MYDLRADQEVIGYQDSSLNAGVTSLALSNSGRLIFAGYDDFNCHIWDTLKGEKVGEWDAHEIPSQASRRLWRRKISSAGRLRIVRATSRIHFLFSPLCPLVSFTPFPLSSHIGLLSIHFHIYCKIPSSFLLTLSDPQTFSISSPSMFHPPPFDPTSLKSIRGSHSRPLFLILSSSLIHSIHLLLS